jgi:hypothetical protein
VFFFDCVLRAARIWVAAFPEGGDKTITIVIAREAHEVFAFLGCDDPTHILCEPLLIFRTQADLQGRLAKASKGKRN